LIKAVESLIATSRSGGEVMSTEPTQRTDAVNDEKTQPSFVLPTYGLLEAYIIGLRAALLWLADAVESGDERQIDAALPNARNVLATMEPLLADTGTAAVDL
jgi:hypothetical protein